MLKFSRQRECIKNFLSLRKDHPTAETVYLAIREEFPNISLGTVYRNLSLLSQLGQIAKVPTNGGADRFDSNIIPHYHFFCTECECVMDLEMEGIDHINLLANHAFDGHVEGHITQFYGICPTCFAKSKKV
ncbi:transcriptional repressor [Lachnospiraceae bacterium ZAX-1]